MGFRSSAAALIAAVVTLPIAAESPDFRPLKPQLPHGSFAACGVRGSDEFGPSREVVVQLEVDETGKIDSFDLPDGSPGWLTDIAACAVERIAFEPEVRAGQPAKTHAQLRMTIGPVTAGIASDIGVVDVGDVITPARFRPRAGTSLSWCLPVNIEQNQVSRLRVTATVAADGGIVATELPVGSEAWMERTTKCIASNLRVYPATRNGTAVESKVELPFVLNEYGSEKYESAKVRAEPAMVESAFRACYPADERATGSVVFKFDANIDGSASNVKLLRGSGNAELDKIASCILPRLKFEPAKLDGKPAKSNVIWELPLRPPS